MDFITDAVNFGVAYLKSAAQHCPFRGVLRRRFSLCGRFSRGGCLRLSLGCPRFLRLLRRFLCHVFKIGCIFLFGLNWAEEIFADSLRTRHHAFQVGCSLRLAGEVVPGEARAVRGLHSLHARLLTHVLGVLRCRLYGPEKVHSGAPCFRCFT